MNNATHEGIEKSHNNICINQQTTWKKYVKAKEELWKLKYFTMHKI
jgi:hypothetical protein